METSTSRQGSRFFRRLINSPSLRRLYYRFGGAKALDAYFRSFPHTVQLTGSNFSYRVRSASALLTAREIFSLDVYGPALEGLALETFADCGCNYGFFPLYLAWKSSRADLAGLAIDANADLVDSARQLFAANRLSGVKCMVGALGSDASADSVDFYISSQSDSSALRPSGDPTREWKRRQVPSVRLGDAWRATMAGRRCSLLKLDIEGAEADFLRQEGSFLSMVDRVVVEWHVWAVTEEVVVGLLEARGFAPRGSSVRSALGGVAVFERWKEPN